MGCDIHPVVEIKVKGKWRELEGLRPDNGYVKYPDSSDFDPGRNYALFGMLAGVRSNFDRLAEHLGLGTDCRGVPEDASDFYKKKVETFGLDGHSHSYFTLKELNTPDYWSKRPELNGILTISDYNNTKKGIVPQDWFTRDQLRWMSVDKIPEAQIFTEEQWNDRITSDAAKFMELDYYIETSFKGGPFLEYSRDFADVMVRLTELADKGNLSHEDVRYLFFFDN